MIDSESGLTENRSCTAVDKAAKKNKTSPIADQSTNDVDEQCEKQSTSTDFLKGVEPNDVAPSTNDTDLNDERGQSSIDNEFPALLDAEVVNEDDVSGRNNEPIETLKGQCLLDGFNDLCNLAICMVVSLMTSVPFGHILHDPKQVTFR